METISTKVAIVGAGPGGLSAGLWCAELGLNHVILESGDEAGGQLLRTFNEIDNYIGLPSRNGRELLDSMLSHAVRRGVKIRFNSGCASFDPEAGTLSLVDGAIVRAQAFIIATGVKRRVPDTAGYDRFIGKGVLFSGKRDKEMARGKRAVVVGGGDAAFENAIILSESAESVTLVHRRDAFTARPEFISAAEADPKIRILSGSVVTELNGGELLESATIRATDTGSESHLAADVIIFRIGVTPGSEMFSPSLRTDAGGYIVVDSQCRTSLPGIYAVGDVANPVSPTVSTAAGMGATAVKSTFFWLQNTSDIQSPESLKGSKTELGSE